jgi:hypothetical protein
VAIKVNKVSCDGNKLNYIMRSQNSETAELSKKKSRPSYDGDLEIEMNSLAFRAGSGAHGPVGHIKIPPRLLRVPFFFSFIVGQANILMGLGSGAKYHEILYHFN